MNKDNAKDFLPLVQALADGKAIQNKHDGEWHDYENLTFTAPSFCYRIKPDPPLESYMWHKAADPARRESFVMCFGSDSGSNWKDAGYTKIKMRQVLED